MTASAQRIITRLKDCGIEISADGGELVLTGRVTDVHVQFVREHKAELLAALQPSNDPSPSTRPTLRLCCDCIHGTPALAGSKVSWHICNVAESSRWHGWWGLSEHPCESWVGSVAPTDTLAEQIARLAGLDTDRMLEGDLSEPEWDRWGNAVAELAGHLDDAGKRRLAALIEGIDARWVANRVEIRP